MTTFDEALLAALARWVLPISPLQLGQLRAHYRAVVEANRTMNLTRIVEPAAAAVKHYADSLALCLWIRECNVEAKTLLDVGTGAGFPAIPLAIVRPDWRVTAIDATRKKVTFVAEAAAAIGLTNLNVEHGHSQHWGKGAAFPIVTLRAVAPRAKALKQAAGHVAPGGWLVIYQTATASTGACEDDRAVAQPGHLHLERVYPYALQAGGETLQRALHVFRKVHPGRET